MKNKIIIILKWFLFTRKKKIEEPNQNLYTYSYGAGTRDVEDEWKDFLRYNKFPFIIGIYYICLIMHMLINIILYVFSIANINTKYLIKNPIYIVLSLLIPVIIWVWSTSFEYWNFYNRKIGSLILISLNILLIICQQICRILLVPVIHMASIIPINNEIKESTVVNLIRFIISISSILPVTILAIFLIRVFGDKNQLKDIFKFKVTRGIDLRKNKEFAYDFKVVKRMEDGKPQVIREKDRALHMVVDGTTGTAKTSSTLEPAIAADLDQKRVNENFQKKECLKYLEAREFEIIKPFNDDDFSINYIKPVLTDNDIENIKRIKEYEFLKYKVQSAGITVVAPNSALADSVYEMATNRKFKVRRIDPILTDDEKQKPGFIGMNPLYISPLVVGIKRDVEITNKATIFADILRGLYELSGASDAYFVSVNNSVTIAICKLLMLTFEDVNGRQPHPGDVQGCINVFQLTKPYIDKLIEKFGNNGEPYLFKNVNSDRVENDSIRNNVNCGIWQDVYTLIFYDLLDANMGPKMYDRANGLRLQINNFMNHPLIRRVLCSIETLDLDQALANGEIIVVNYALELGQSVSMAYGLFFLLSFSKAVLRRPGNENTRILNFDYIDEFPVLLHPHLEEFFSLFRQYCVANVVALQTLDQLDKNQMTRYLKSVLLGVGHQIVFGRVSPTEMSIYEQMAGTTTEIDRQNSISQTSITSENPMYNYSSRESLKEVKHTDGTEIRYRDFQEVTFFTTEASTPLRPIIGKVNFLPVSKRKGLPGIYVNWSKYYSDEVLVMEKKDQELNIQKINVNKKLNELENINTTPLFETISRVRRRDHNKDIKFSSKGIITNDSSQIKTNEINEQENSNQSVLLKVSSYDNNESDDLIVTGSILTSNKDLEINENLIEDNYSLDDLFSGKDNI